MQVALRETLDVDPESVEVGLIEDFVRLHDVGLRIGVAAGESRGAHRGKTRRVLPSA